MAFNEDQIFYACLWWAQHLPGGASQAEAICARYNKAPIEFPEYEPTYKPFDASDIRKSAVAREFNKLGFKERLAKIHDGEFDRAAMEEISQPLPPEQIDLFFDELFRETKRKAADITANNPRVPINFIMLEQSPVTSSQSPAFPDHPFTDVIEIAMNRAEIDRGRMPQRGYVEFYSDGQMFVKRSVTRDKMPPTVELDYPQKPVLPYKHFPMTAESMDSCPQLSWKLTYRIVPLEEGQEYRVTWPQVGGGQYVSPTNIASKGEAIFIQRHEFLNPDDFDTMSDEDIIALHPSVKMLSVRNLESVMGGTDYLYFKMRVETTDKPNIIHEYMENIAYMVVNRPLQIGRGFEYRVVQPGDYIIRESEKSSPRVISKALIERGAVNFIFPDKESPAPGTKGPRFN